MVTQHLTLPQQDWMLKFSSEVPCMVAWPAGPALPCGKFAYQELKSHLLSLDHSASQIYLYLSGSRPETEQIVGVTVAQRVTRARRLVGSQQLAALPAAAGQAAATPASAAHSTGFIARAGAGFAADSTDAGGGDAQPGCCTPAQRGLAAGDAASPSGNATPRVQGTLMAADVVEATPCRPAASGTPRRLLGHSTGKRQKTMRQCFAAGPSRPAGSGAGRARPADSGASEPPTPCFAAAAAPGRAAPADAMAAAAATATADAEVTSPLQPARPLATLQRDASPLPAASSADSAASRPCEEGAGGGGLVEAEASAAAAALPEAAGCCSMQLPADDRAQAQQPAAAPKTAAAASAVPQQRTQQQQQQQPPQPASLSFQTGPPERADCGVRVLWVSLESRRKGIAGKLLDAVR